MPSHQQNQTVLQYNCHIKWISSCVLTHYMHLSIVRYRLPNGYHCWLLGCFLTMLYQAQLCPVTPVYLQHLKRTLHRTVHQVGMYKMLCLSAAPLLFFLVLSNSAPLSVYSFFDNSKSLLWIFIFKENLNQSEIHLLSNLRFSLQLCPPLYRSSDSSSQHHGGLSTQLPNRG